MTTSATPPPGDRAAILTQIGPCGRVIFEAVRGIVDDLETAAPWDFLYSPPDAEAAFLDTQRRLLQVVEGIPARVQSAFDQLARLHPPPEMAVGELAAFFDTTFLIISRERDQLAAAVANHQRTAWTEERRGHVCQLAADLKGKYESALMGVAGKVAAQGRWSGVEVEPILFDEKREEFERNHALVGRLERVTAQIRDITADLPLAELIAAWAVGRRTDRYALVELTVVAGEVGQLLKTSSRRALYSGDYHQILDRERLLSARVSKLQIMHASIWSATTNVHVAGVYPRLVELAVEIAAILDLRLLRSLLGDARFTELRALAGTAAVTPPNPNPSHDQILVSLIRAGDLRSFLEALLSNVMRRESLVAERIIVASGPSPSELDAHSRIRTVLAALTSAERPQWQAFLAAGADSRTTPILAMEQKRDLAVRLIPLLGEVPSLSQFGAVLASTCNEIHSSADRQPMQTVVRLLNRLSTVVAAP